MSYFQQAQWLIWSSGWQIVMSHTRAASSFLSMSTKDVLTEDPTPVKYAPRGAELKKGNVFFISATNTQTYMDTVIPDTPRKVDSVITAHIKQSHSTTQHNSHRNHHRGCFLSSLLDTLTTALSKYSLTVSLWTFWHAVNAQWVQTAQFDLSRRIMTVTFDLTEGKKTESNQTENQ